VGAAGREAKAKSVSDGGTARRLRRDGWWRRLWAVKQTGAITNIADALAACLLHAVTTSNMAKKAASEHRTRGACAPISAVAYGVRRKRRQTAAAA